MVAIGAAMIAKRSIDIALTCGNVELSALGDSLNFRRPTAG